MGKEIVIKAGEVVLKGEMKDTTLSEKIYQSLPFTSIAKRWGKEIYFEIPVESKIEKVVEEVEKGDIAYWPEGRCMCIFFGPTPVSKGGKIIPASAVEIIGKITSDCTACENVRDGEKIIVERD